MSYSAQGWAQRQVFGSPILKGVMQALCYLMRDDELTVYAAVVNPPDKVSLEKLTEYEARAIRKALRDLVDLGFLQDTGERRRNMVVWRMPRYEAWLARAEIETPPVNGSGQDSAQAAGTQVNDSDAENSEEIDGEDDPSRVGEGSSPEITTPPVQVADPSRPGNTTPPVQGRESSLDPGSTKPARAMRLEDWKQQARVKLERAPEKPTKENPTVICRGHLRFWKTMVGWYGALWLHQFGDWPPIEWTRLLNLWNSSGKWAELDQLIGDLTLDKPPKPPTLAEIEARFRAQAKAAGPKYDERQSREQWARYTFIFVVNVAHLYGLAKYGANSFEQIDANVRERIRRKCVELVERAIACEKEIPPRARRVIEQICDDELNSELQLLRRPLYSERAVAEA